MTEELKSERNKQNLRKKERIIFHSVSESHSHTQVLVLITELMLYRSAKVVSELKLFCQQDPERLKLQRPALFINRSGTEPPNL